MIKTLVLPGFLLGSRPISGAFFLSLGAGAPSQAETHPSQKLFMPIFVLYG
jgi:hypothetical protein